MRSFSETGGCLRLCVTELFGASEMEIGHTPGGLRTSEGVRRLLKYHGSGSNVMEGLWRGELRVRLAIFNHQGESDICWFVWLHSPDFCESPHLC